jgi:hypothetical protein
VAVIAAWKPDWKKGAAKLVAQSPRGKALLEAYAHWRTQVYVLSYPKCGRTWLRLMIGKALDEQYGLGVANPMQLGAMHHRHRAIPRIRLSHEHSHRTETIETQKVQYRGKTVVLLVRDPRDVVVSMYFEATRRRDMFSGDLSAFLRSPMSSLESILDYYNAWAENRRIPRRFGLARYEDLHANPAQTLRAVLGTIGVTVEQPALDRAIEFSRFDNMRALEQRDAYGELTLRAKDASDPESFKTRKGKVGGYREYLSGADLDYVNGRIRERLSDYYDAYR